INAWQCMADGFVHRRGKHLGDRVINRVYPRSGVKVGLPYTNLIIQFRPGYADGQARTTQVITGNGSLDAAGMLSGSQHWIDKIACSRDRFKKHVREEILARNVAVCWLSNMKLTVCVLLAVLFGLSARLQLSDCSSSFPVRRAEPDVILPLRIGLTQSNLESIEDYLLDVSHPESPNYGSHWSPAKVAAMFRPSRESIDSVQEWLANGGIDPTRISLSTSGGWLRANVTVEEAERLLETEYYVYEHEADGTEHIACENAYHLPEHISKHVDIVTPTLHFDIKLGSASIGRKRSPRWRGQKHGHGSQPTPPKMVGKSQKHQQYPANSLNSCADQITPACLRALYDFNYTPVATNRNSIGVVEYTPDIYNPSDFDVFFKRFSPSQVGQRPKMISIDGGTINVPYADNINYYGEANLDLQYAMALGDKTRP
ncbi:Tripeptidyl-peptidase SED1, partial [Grifola frondosa]